MGESVGAAVGTGWGTEKPPVSPYQLILPLIWTSPSPLPLQRFKDTGWKLPRSAFGAYLLCFSFTTREMTDRAGSRRC